MDYLYTYEHSSLLVNMKTTLTNHSTITDEPAKGQPEQEKRRPSRASKSSLDNKIADDAPKRRSKKRSKDEVDEMSSPEQDKRPKRNASVKAQGVISKQVKK